MQKRHTHKPLDTRVDMLGEQPLRQSGVGRSWKEFTSYSGRPMTAPGGPSSSLLVPLVEREGNGDDDGRSPHRAADRLRRRHHRRTARLRWLVLQVDEARMVDTDIAS